MNRILAFLIFTFYVIISASQDCTDEMCPEYICASCPAGARWGRDPAGCCDCCVDSSRNTCVGCGAITTSAPINCEGQACPDFICASCPSGAQWGRNPQGCCGCCVDSTTNSCVGCGSGTSPINCTGHACPQFICSCPSGAHWGTDPNGCCGCCVDSELNRCVGCGSVTPSPVSCPREECITLPVGEMCPTGSSWNNIPSANGCPNCPCCHKRSTGKCVQPVVDCSRVFCPAAPSRCPSGSSKQKKGCCQCCVSHTSGNCVPGLTPAPTSPDTSDLELSAPTDCSGVTHCPLAPVASACAAGSVLKNNPCCPCCVNTESGQCESPPDCSQPVNCPFISTNPRCPRHSTFQTKGCCPCCVSQKTGDCVSACQALPCPMFPPPNKVCPSGSAQNTVVNSQTGCPGCPCCVSHKTGKCVTPITVYTGAIQP